MKKKLIGRLLAIWKILTTKNFILIHSVKEYTVDSESGRKFKIIRRTDYTDESDALTLKASFITLHEKIKPEW